MATTRRGSSDNIFNKAKTNLKPAQTKEVEEVKVEEKVIETPIIKEEIEVKKEVPQKETKPKKEKSKTTKNDLFSSKKKGARGVQKTIYLKADVYAYLEDVCKEYEMQVSEAINIIIKAHMENEE